MAPSRRRGIGKASSAAAAVAAASKWKVGDLVLAKVKGFPAWPATVSEPEKWGYSNDRKKVLVYFFGTKQIAFCNPADVESFTEDKKKSLLVKRQGRGADYVHALQEIVVCFDKLKEQDHGDEVNFGDETTISHAENLDDSVDKAGEMCPIQSPSVLIPYPTLERIYDSTERCDLRDPVEVQEAVKHDVETTSEEPAKNAVCVDSYKETTLAAINTIRKPKDTPIESCDIQKQVPFRKFRNVSSRVDPCKFQVGIKKTDDVVPRAILYEAASRKLRIRKSPDGFDLHDMELSPGVSSTFPSNNSSEDNDFDTFSLAKPCRLESTCKSEQPEVVELLEKGVQLRERLHFQSKTVVLKRKRKPNRKRVAHDAETITASPAEEAGIEISVIETIQNPPPPCERIRECCPKADGDEHLPLVKRARVRMSKLPLQEKEQSDFISAEEKSSAEAPLNHSVPVSSSFDHATKFHPETEPHSWTAKIYQLRACSVDGEAALPPSKRLHRALEAMSANAAEEIQAYNELHYASKVICGNDCSDSSEKCSSNTAMGNVAESFLKVRNMKSDESGPAQNTCGSSPSLPSPTSEVSEKSSSAIKPCGLHIRHSFTPEHEDCKDMLNEDRNVEDSEVVKDTSLNNTHTDTEIKFEGLRPSSNYDEKQEGGLSSGLDYFNQSPSVKENKHGILGTRTHSCESIRDHTASLSNPKGTDSVSEGKEVVSPLEATDVLLSAANEWSSENTKSLICPSHDKVKSMSEVVKEVNHKVRQVDRVAPSYNTSSLKGLIAVAHAKRHSSHSASLCDHMLDDMSPSLIQREDSYEQVSSPSSIICHSSTVDSAGYLLHSSAGSPDILPCHKKTTTVLDMDLANMELSLSQKHKSLTEWKVEANAVQKSFESMLKALSRTKESIGRATRLAIDCLKYGITGEVVDIIVRNLERESSMHKKVDLFFLVDSILQCSRSHKGDVGDLYPSAVQSVLPRLLSAAAPPGNAAWENRKQCLKVLRLWLERKTLSESLVRHHIRELDSITDASLSNAFCRRPSRTERPLDDPVREMEGMLVDEYGSNASFQLPGFSMPPMLEEEDGSDADDKSFEAVTPEHDPEVLSGREIMVTSATEKHRHILEDVDGELEMEDVAPSIEVNMNSIYPVETVHNASLCRYEQQRFQFPLGPPPLPENLPPSPPPLPTSPPPIALPLAPIPHPPSATIHPVTGSSKPNIYLTTHSVPSAILGTLDTVQYHASQYGDFTIDHQKSGPSIPSDIRCSQPGSNPLIHNSSNACHLDDTPLHQKGYQLQPPLPTHSSQFSYFQSNHRMQSWTDASSSSSYSKRFQYGQDIQRENTYENRETMELAADEIGNSRRKFNEHSHSGPIHSDNPEASYGPVPYYGPPQAPTRMLNRGLSFPPKVLHFGHPSPRRPPESTFFRSNRAPNLWRPR